MVHKPMESDINHWFVGTVEGVVDRLRRESSKDIYSLGIKCPNMSFTTPEKVSAAKELLEDGGPVAEARYVMSDRPYFDVEILRPEVVKGMTEGSSRTPAVRITVEQGIGEKAKRALESLL